jgi:membrane glycosyltransferase
MSPEATGTQKLSFDEFKLYYESTEKVTDRRLSANTWNYSICIGMIIAVAGIIKWSASSTFFYVGLTAILVLCIMAILFCTLWLGQITDFKYLNNAKFKVLNEMAPQMEFDLEHPNKMASFCPFEKEWKTLEEVKAAVEIGHRKIIALKSSSIEYFIPKAFRILFILVGVAASLAGAFNWSSFVGSWKSILHAQ